MYIYKEAKNYIIKKLLLSQKKIKTTWNITHKETNKQIMRITLNY